MLGHTILPGWLLLLGMLVMLAMSPAIVTAIALLRRERVSRIHLWAVLSYYLLLAVLLAAIIRIENSAFVGVVTFLSTILGSPLAIWIHAAVRTDGVTHPESPPFCKNCNYNLTANESGKCPECGTPTPNSKPAASTQTPKA